MFLGLSRWQPSSSTVVKDIVGLPNHPNHHDSLGLLVKTSTLLKSLQVNMRKEMSHDHLLCLSIIPMCYEIPQAPSYPVTVDRMRQSGLSLRTTY
jgi:hypothetical protein